jgi:hypothetical protein
VIGHALASEPAGATLLEIVPSYAGRTPAGLVTARVLLRILIVQVLLGLSLVVTGVAEAATSCGSSGGHTVCVTVPGGTLTGPTQVTVTNSPNSGTVIGTWIPSGKPAINLILKTVPSPQTNDYSFVWPTQKYLDDPGVLRLQSGTTASTPVDISVTLSNGNATDFQHSPNDWASFLPGPWTQSQDP